MPQGTIGVHATLERPKEPKKQVFTRVTHCSKGHAVGQVFIQAMEGFAGACPVCGEKPKD